MDLVAGTELIKLLLQVVTADDVVSAGERAVLDATARRIAGPDALEVIRLSLDEGKPLPAPNLALLLPHRGDVLREVARVAAVDGIHRDELDMVKIIGGLLL
ncbi:MAG: TerB family tellurite resistance protein [Deltaproteobacteria bacterium]|nr:TerB family tellurite resistance protein [Deltaproteobacteria bacterium]